MHLCMAATDKVLKEELEKKTADSALCFTFSKISNFLDAMLSFNKHCNCKTPKLIQVICRISVVK